MEKIRVPKKMLGLMPNKEICYKGHSIYVNITAKLLREGSPTLPKIVAREVAIQNYNIKTGTWEWFSHEKYANKRNYYITVQAKWRKNGPSYRYTYWSTRTNNIIWSRWVGRDQFQAQWVAVHILGAQ